MPFRELGFHGVPHRTNSFIMPTVNCLVELTEMPFPVLTLSGAGWGHRRAGKTGLAWLRMHVPGFKSCLRRCLLCT